MKAGNTTYLSAEDLPEVVPVFPLSGALLLPGGQMPLNIFEPRYLAMFDDAIGSHRLVGMVQPRAAVRGGSATDDPERPALCELGCLGRVTAFQESGDGRYLVNLTGVCRYRILGEAQPRNGYRMARIAPCVADLRDDGNDARVDRTALLDTFRKYLKANDMDADWDSIRQASSATLVTALCMMSPYGPAEKQALLEAEDIKARAETLVAITEIALARASGETGAGLH